MVERIFQARFHDRRAESIWLTIYADLITTLMMLFLALFGLTVIGDRALREAIMSMNIDDVAKLEQLEMDEFDVVAQKIKREFIQVPAIMVVKETGKAQLSFGESVLFKSGGAQLRQEAEPLVEKLSQFLKDVPYTVVVEGHTDSLPLTEKAQFKNNWELSLARSMTVVRLLEKHGLDSNRVAAAAYGFNRPKATNQTAGGRRQNRRVEITLLKDYPYNRPEGI